MEGNAWEYVIWAGALGGLSAVSLPLGSLTGISMSPRPQLISILAAFGAGALIAALSVELVAPTVSGLHEPHGASGHGDPLAGFEALMWGLPIGGLVFVVLDQIVNAQGGFLRKTATSISYFGRSERKRQEALIERIATHPGFQNVPAEHINTVVPMIRSRHYLGGDVILDQGDPVREVIFVVNGEVEVLREGHDAGDLGSGDSIGLGAVLADMPFPARATAKGPVDVHVLSRSDFDRLREISPEFDEAFRKLGQARLEELGRFEKTRREHAVQWAHEATNALQTGTQIPTADQLQRAKEEHHGAPLAIWTGMLIDGIPESVVVGAGLFVSVEARRAMEGSVSFVDVIPFTLIAGLFLANYPEALASSANMKRQHWSKRTILGMWVSLMAITAVGSGLGYLMAGVLDPTWLVFAEGLAAGAMLTMIAAAMIPEAVLMGNAHLVGLSTLGGFLAAIAFKVLE